jgi:hypothetical protein
MRYRIFFTKSSDDPYDNEELDEWKRESVVPRTGDNVFMKKGGWMTVSSVGFSTLEKGRRLVLISVK